jgi:phage/plasmid-associated DNA primase
MIDGCLEWQRIGLDPPQSIIDATQEYLDSENTHKRWMEDQGTYGANEKTATSAAWANFKQWAINAGEFVGSQRAFTEKMSKDKKLTWKKLNTGNIYLGFKLNSHIIMTWFRDRCVIKAGGWLSLNDAYGDFTSWCTKANEKPLGKQAFIEQLLACIDGIEWVPKEKKQLLDGFNGIGWPPNF